MESGSFRQSSMPRLRGGQWASEHCVQKVEEMLSRAIVHQEDLLGLLTSNTPESASLDAQTGHVITPEAISPPVLRALKAKIENSMDWCHLALCRLREIVLHSPSPSPSLSTQHSMGSSGGAGLLSSYSKCSTDAAAKLVNHPHSSPRLNVPTPLSPLRVLLRKEPLSPHPFTVQSQSGSAWNPGNLLFNDHSAPLLQQPSHAPPGEDSSSQQRQQQHQQGQNFARLPTSFQMDTSDVWPALLSETTGPINSTISPPLPSDPRQCSSSCQINAVGSTFNGGEVADHYTNIHAAVEDQSFINKVAPIRGNRSRNSTGKSEVRKLSGGEAKLQVVFQKLNDAKKGIPDDGHRGWKKYGNKSIQNSIHCRGYYKCSVKECRAKKMVQPTDKDPTTFEVTYVGKHTCSSTGQRRNRSARTSASNPTVQVGSIQVVAQRQEFGINGSSEEGQAKSAVTKDDEQATLRGTHISVTEWKKHDIAGMDHLQDGSILTGSNSVSEEWAGALPTGSPCKRGRPNEDERASLYNYSYLNMTASTATTSKEEREQLVGDGDSSMDTYLHQSSRHHQAVYAFQEPLLWHDFDMDTNLSTGHKSISIDSDSP